MKMEQIIGSSVPEPLPAKAAPLPDNLSPQCIGREFVRCYYTLMHDNPNKLHRFYLDQSTFVHGNQTDETAGCVSGQRAIHEKIISLNFVDCRTKIKHVDSQPTIDNGVVVQVSGELSNAGKVPRRFMQTFVLGSQTPRKYYVHNDIFRYQDEVFGYEQDEAPEDEEASLDSTDELPEHHEEEEVEVEEEEVEVVSEQPFYEEASNGVVEEDQNHNHEEHEEEVEAEEEPVEECEPEEAVAEQPEAAVEEESVEEEEPEFVPIPEEEPVEEVVEEPVHVAPEVAPEPVPEVPKGPKSWAMIAGAGSAPATVVRVPPAQTTPPKQPKPAPEPKEAPKIKETPFQPFPKDPEVREVRESRGGRRGRSDSRGDRGDRGERSERRFEGAGAFKERERYQEREAPNSYQIFVGNLPSGTGYADLEEHFRSYGNVVHVRVTPNNFGFVVFESEAPVQEILGEVRNGKKFFLNDQRLNIEEKKTAINPSRGPRKPFSDQRGTSRGGRGRRGGGRPPFIDNNSDSK